MQRPGRTILALVIVVATAMVACASTEDTGEPGNATSDDATSSGDVESQDGDMSTEPPATTSDTSEASGSDSSSAVADLPDGGFTFMRTGGIAGVEDELVVQPDGSFTVQGGEGSRNGTLDPDELADLAAAVDELDWAALEAAASGAAADDDYAFTVSAGGRSVAIPGSQLPRPVPELFVVAQELLEQD